MKYIDIHSHINFAAYDADREAVIERARNAGVAMIDIGTNLETSKKAVELAEKHPDLYATVGLHPVHTSSHPHPDPHESVEAGDGFFEVPDMDAYRALAAKDKVVAIGECGLDFFHLDEDQTSLQKKVFESMADLSLEVNKPLMLHLRSESGRSAYNEAFDILKSKPGIAGNLHFYAGSIEEAKPFLDMGFTFSFTGVITFARNYDEVIKYLPMDSIMSETDCPYVAPKPYRGKRNEPAYVIEVVRALAGIKGVDEAVMAGQIMENAKRVFGV